jgi:hypothetical protein
MMCILQQRIFTSESYVTWFVRWAYIYMREHYKNHF